MIKIRTVRRNAKKQLDQIFQDGTFTIHTLDNSFKGKHVQKSKNKFIKEEYEKFRHARISINADEKTGHVHFHSNYWYKFQLPKKMKR